MKNIWLLAIPFMFIACGGGEEETDSTESETNETEVEVDTVVEEEIDPALLPEAYEGEVAAQFDMNYGEENLTFQLAAQFYDDETHAQVEMQLWTGSVERGELPYHPAGKWWVEHPTDGKVPVEVVDFNDDGYDDLKITIQAFTGMGPEGSIPFGVPSIYFQREDGTFINTPVIDDEITEESSIDTIKSLSVGLDPNAF